MIQLYVDNLRISPYALHAFVGLKEKGLTFDVCEVALGRKEQQAPSYQAKSTNGKIPCLMHDNFFVSESTAILEYLEDKFAFPNYPRIYPADIEERAQARQIVAWMNSDFLGLRQSRPSSVVFYGPTKEPLSTEADNDRERLIELGRRFLLTGREYLFGSWSIADSVFAMMLNRLVASQDKMPQYLVDYTLRQWKRPSMAEFKAFQRRPFEPYY